jgi:hypothetical protein
MTTRYRKKPVVIEAEQYHGDPRSLTPEFRAALCHAPCPISGFRYDHGTQIDHIDTLEGAMQVRDEDWIIRGVAGEFYPCRDDIFQQTYEPVDDS